jgi:enoyl-[acyl-carrier protein] reductase I
MYTLDLSGKTGIVFGVANQRSLAYAIAKDLARFGVRLAFTYQSERFREGVERLVHPMEGALTYECDVTSDEDLERTFASVAKEFGKLDFVVHSVAFARREELEGEFVNTTREGFRTALEISAYSMIPMARLAAPLMDAAGGGSIVCLSYIAAVRAIPNYNVMGTAKAALEQITRQLAMELGPRNIRVNAISAGPVNTVSARGISGFGDILKFYEEHTPMKRNITRDEVGKAGLFMLSDMASGITGTTLYVDAGYHAVGL